MRRELREQKTDSVDPIGRRRLPSHGGQGMKLDELNWVAQRQALVRRVACGHCVAKDVPAARCLLNRLGMADEVGRIARGVPLAGAEFDQHWIEIPRAAASGLNNRDRRPVQNELRVNEPVDQAEFMRNDFDGRL